MADNPYFDPSAVAPGQATPEADANPYFDANEAAANQQRLRGVLDVASKANPDQAAESQRLARQTGLPTDTVERNLDEVRRRAQVQAIDTQRMRAESPVLARQLADPEFAKIAHDDTENLGMAEKALRGFGNFILRPIGGEGMGRFAQAGYSLAAMPFDALKWLAQPLEDYGVVPLNPFGAPSEFFHKQATESGAYADQEGLQAGEYKNSLERGIASGISSLWSSMLTLPLGAEIQGEEALTKIGAFVAPNVKALLPMGLQTGGQAYGEATDAGLPGLQAFMHGAEQGMVEMLTESLPLGEMLKGAHGGQGFVKTLAKTLVEENVGEQVATAWQDANDWLNLHPEKSLQDYLDARPQAALETAIATTFSAGLQTSLMHLSTRAARAQAAEQHANQLDILNQIMSANKVLKRDPEAVQAFLQQAAAEGKVQDIYIDAETLHQTGLADQLAAVSPSVAAQLPEASMTGGTVRIPLAEYAAKIAPTELAQPLLDHIRVDDPNGFSRAEAKEFMQSKMEDLQTEVAKVLDTKADDVEFKASFNKLKMQIQTRLDELGVNAPHVNEFYALQTASYAAARAAQLGVSPEQFFKDHLLRIESERQAGLQFDQGGAAQTESPEFKAWFGDSKVVDAQGKPLVVYHGTRRGGFTEFQASEAPYAQGMVFTSNREIALTYSGQDTDLDGSGGARSVRAGVYPAYLSSQNMKVVDWGGDYFQKDDGTHTNDAIAQAKAEGYDGVLLKNVNDPGGFALAMQSRGKVPDGTKTTGDVYVVFHPEQIKSATGNNGNFDPNDPNILHQRGEQKPGKEVPTSVDEVSNVEAAFQLAGSQSFKTNRDLKLALQARVVGAAIAAKVNLDEFSKATEDYLVRIATADGSTALRTNANAVGWYNDRVTKALRLVSLIHPEVATDPKAKFAFVWAMAVTSNGLKVDKNFELAEKAYSAFKANGTMPTNIGIGTAAAAINRTLALYNTLVDKYGFEAVERFMTTLQKAGDVEKFTGLKVSGENKGTMVYGAAALGPKIGNGFFMNLYGRFEQLTMDRWLMRTWGRWTGTLIEANPDQVRAKRTSLKGLIRALSPQEKKAFESIIKRKLTLADVDEVGIAIWKASQKPENRAAMSAIGGLSGDRNLDELLGAAKPDTPRVSVGDELRKVGNALTKYLDGQKEAPAGPPERGNIRKVFGRVLAELQAEHPALTMADLQAVLWYPEKRLYDAAKTSGEASDGYEDDEAPDYANAAAKLARSQGVSEDAIAGAIAAVDAELQANGRAAGTRSTDRGSGTGVYNQSGFDRFVGDATRVDLGDAHEFKAGEPVVVAALHGTTGDFDTFDKSKSSVESDLGGGFYFTNNPEDVGNNYAGEGPDLTSRIERRAEQLFDQMDDDELVPLVEAATGKNWDELSYEEKRAPLKDLARKQLTVQHGGATMPVWVKFTNPVVLGGSRPTFLDFESEYDEENDEYGEPKGALVDVIEGLRQVAADYDGADVDDAINSLDEAQADGGINATTLIEKLSNSTGLMYAENDIGQLVSKEIIRRAFEYAGFDGIIDQTVNEKFGTQRQRGQGMKGMDEGTVHFIAFEPTQIKSRVGNSGEFDESNPSVLHQGEQTGNRGAYNPALNLITLLKDADLSTFLHESGHYFFETDIAIARSLLAKPERSASEQQILDDVSKLLAWHGITGDPAQQIAAWDALDFEQKRDAHERTAEAYEAYLFEGKAPSLELEGAFRAFSSWLRRVYSSLKDFFARHPEAGKINDEIRGVFDRMLATADQIKIAEAAREMAPLFADASEAAKFGLDAETYQRMHMEATLKAVDYLQAKGLRDMRWLSKARGKQVKRLKREVAALRETARAQVEAEVSKQPVYQAIRWLTTGQMTTPEGEQIKADKGFKLDTEAVKEMYPESMLDRPNVASLARMTSPEGLAPDLVAEMFGYPSGDAMIRDILAATPFAKQVQAETDKRLLEQHGDLVTPEGIEREADKAVHNELRARVLETETNALDKALGKPRVLAAAAKQVAERILAGVVVKKLSPRQYAAAEAKAARAAAAAFKKGDIKTAAAEKRKQLLNNYAAKAAYEAQDEVRAIAALFRRIVGRSDEKVGKSMDMDIVAAARAVLADHGYGAKAKRAGEYLAAVQNYDPATFQALKELVEEAESIAPGKLITDMTVGELRQLADEMRWIWTMAKRSREVMIDGVRQQRDDIAKQLVARMEAIGLPPEEIGAASAVTPGEERLLRFSSVKAWLRRVESWVGSMDGQNMGVFRRFIWTPIKEAADRYRGDKANYLRKFRATFSGVESTMRRGLIAAPELGYTFGKDEAGVGMNELLHALLHTGNESNKRKLLLGRGWATEMPDGTLNTMKWDAFLQRAVKSGILTQAHFDFAQRVWDLMEELKPLAQKAHRDAYGRYFSEVTATPFGIEFPGGARVQYNGGYVPAMTDSRIVKDAELRKLIEEGKDNISHAFPATAKGFTKSRVEYNRPLLLDLRTLPQHIDKVLLFSHLEMPVRDATRLLTHKDVSTTLNKLDPGAISQMLLPWLNRTARQQVTTPVAGAGWMAAWVNTLRNRTSLATMFGNVSNAIQQLSGFTLAAVKVSPSHLASAMAHYMAGPRAMAESVADASTYMSHRMADEVGAMMGEVDKILLDPSLYEQTQEWVKHHQYFLQSAIDNVMGPVIWTAAYNQEREKGVDHKDSVRFADSVIRETQGSSLPEDVSRIEVQNAFMRVFLQFAGYFNMQANLLGGEFGKIMRAGGLRKNMGRGLYVFTMGFYAASVVAEAIAQAFKGGPGDDDKDGEYLDDWLMALFVYGPMRNATAFVPGVGQVANSMVARFNSNPNDDRVSTAPAVSMLEGAAGVPYDLYREVVGKGNHARTVKDVATLISMTTGLPANTIARPIAYLAGVEQHKTNPTGPVDAARGVVTGAASPQSRR